MKTSFVVRGHSSPTTGSHPIATMAPSSSTAVLVAGSLLLAGLSYTYVTNGTKDTGKNTLALKEIDEEKEEDFITAEEVCKIFDELFLQMQEV